MSQGSAKQSAKRGEKQRQKEGVLQNNGVYEVENSSSYRWINGKQRCGRGSAHAPERAPDPKVSLEQKDRKE